MNKAEFTEMMEWAKEQTMTNHDLAVAFAKGLEEEGVTDEELKRIIYDAEEEVREEVARMKGADE